MKINSQQCFLECQGTVACFFKDKSPKKCWRSRILRYYSVTQKTAVRTVCALAGVFWKHGGEKKRTKEQDLWTAFTFPGRSFSKVTVSIHQFTLISTFRSCSCTRRFAQEPCHESTVNIKMGILKLFFKWPQSQQWAQQNFPIYFFPEASFSSVRNCLVFSFQSLHLMQIKAQLISERFWLWIQAVTWKRWQNK